jgi:HEAT repeat protein
VDFRVDRAVDVDAKEGEQMEAIFALSEIVTLHAVVALRNVADTDVASEVRAAAVWGLGLGARPTLELLVPLTADDDDLVALHAASTMPDGLSSYVVDVLVQWLQVGTLRQITTAAHLLARHGHARTLLEAAASSRSDRARSVALLAIGDADPADVGDAIESVDATTAARLRTLWARSDDWLRAPDTDGGLDVLARQRVRL